MHDAGLVPLNHGCLLRGCGLGLGLLCGLLPGPLLAQPGEPDRNVVDAALERERERDLDPLGWYVPDFVRAQTGGWVGMFSAGTGYAIFDDVLNFTLLYGFTPEFHAGQDVHALHAALSVRPVELRMERVRLVPVYAGGGLLMALDRDYFVEVPDHYPDRSYYPPTALHWTAHLGIELDYLPPPGSAAERHGLYLELVTVDTFLFAYIENPETVGLTDVVASAIGYRLAF